VCGVRYTYLGPLRERRERKTLTSGGEGDFQLLNRIPHQNSRYRRRVVH
jgi:hypothetical protein